jgi:hypothetical protein
MSLFDLIRHPINDIYNNRQLSHVPPFILRAWVELCAADAHVDLNEHLTSLSAFAGLFTTAQIIKICVKQRVLHQNLRAMHTSDILTGFEVKEQYTKMLRELVYENEYYGD